MASRQRVKLRRNAGVFSSTSLPELARQTKEAFDLLAAQNAELQSMLLQIIDGTATPKRLLPLHEKLEFAGAGVTLTSTADRNVATITGGLTSATGLDGVDTSTPTAATVIVRLSRDVLTDTISATQNNYNTSGFLTTDFIFATASGGNRNINGIVAPGVDDTIWKVWRNDGASNDFLFNHLSGSATGAQIRTPGGTTFRLRPGNSTLLFFKRSTSEWLLIDREWATDMPTVITDHGGLTGLGDDDHTQYILVAGTRAFSGNQSMGNNALTDINHLRLLGQTSVASTSAGEVRLWGFENADGNPGMLVVMPGGNDALKSMGSAYDVGTTTTDASGSVDINFASLNGRDLGDGIFKICAQFFAHDVSTPGSYPLVFLERWGLYAGPGLGCITLRQQSVVTITGTDHPFEVPAFWDSDIGTTVTTDLTFSKPSSEVVRINWNLDKGADARTWRWWVLATVTGGP
jgi:hypothetical protein